MNSILEGPQNARGRRQSGTGQGDLPAAVNANLTAGRFTFTGSLPPATAAKDAAVAGGSIAALSHDIRNILSALNLYSDLLAEPEVLNPGHQHYADDLRLVAQAGSKMLERLAGLPSVISRAGCADGGYMLSTTDSSWSRHSTKGQPEADRGECGVAAHSLAQELDSIHKMLSALVGPSIHIESNCGGYEGPCPLASEDLTRVLINLVRNASEAMPGGGAIDIDVREVRSASGMAGVLLSVADNGPGIAEDLLPLVFDCGYSTRHGQAGKDSWTAAGIRGLGLAIVRDLVESTGGTIEVTSVAGKGARFEMTFPSGVAHVAPTEAVVEDHNNTEESRVQCLQ